MDKKEINYFEETLSQIDKMSETLTEKIKAGKAQVEKDRNYISENYYEISKNGDLTRYYTDLAQIDDDLTNLEKDLKKLSRQRLSPYFARIDFKADGETQAMPLYIGLGTVSDGEKVSVYDWRAPISSMYYDFGLGRAFYYVDRQATAGEISLKRQYKIENGILKSYFDTNLTIDDQILRDILSKNTSSKMKQIVATIQTEQNEIVRTEEYEHLLVQGVAGSGKTSIALHRAAYLLYRHRKTLKSEDVLIISPNNIFSSYISEVLPELGEDNIAQTTFAQIASVELKKPLQTREEMLDEIATNPKQELLNEISFKSSFEYLDELLKFLHGDLSDTFNPPTLRFVTKVDDEGNPCDEIIFAADQTQKLFFETFKGLTIHERIKKIAWQYAMVFTTTRHYNKQQNRGLRDRFVKLLYNFLPISDVDKIFEIFQNRMGMKVNKKDRVDYMDKGALLLIKHYLYGFSHDFSAKYLIIDEVQDFTPVDLYMFKQLWRCPSILLGDKNQCIEKCLPDEYIKRLIDLWGAQYVELKKTYRSTKQIAQFTHQMLGLTDIEYVNRDGDQPRLLTATAEDIGATLKELIDSECADFEHIAIICKCKREAKELGKLLKGKLNFKYIENPDDYNNRILLTTCATAKGIEFDAVIIPYANEENYFNSLDRNILYVSSTRALHKLFFVATSKPSKFLSKIANV